MTRQAKEQSPYSCQLSLSISLIATVRKQGLTRIAKRQGHWKTYYINGKIFESGIYASDHKIDKWKTNYYDRSEQN